MRSLSEPVVKVVVLKDSKVSCHHLVLAVARGIGLNSTLRAEKDGSN